MSVGQATLELPDRVEQYLTEHHTLTLATASPTGLPRASTFLYVNDGPTLYFWSRPTTVTARQIQQNPIVSFTIDDYSEDLDKTQGVQGVGECSVLLSGEQIAKVADLFGQKFPNLAPGATMSISFFRITPAEMQFIDNTGPSSSTESSASGVFGAEFHRDRSYSVIANLPTQAVDKIIHQLTSSTVPAGEMIVRQGQPADKLFIVIDGQAEVVREAEGQPTQIATLGPGELFGEVAIMRDEPRAASVRATTDVSLLALDRAAFRDLIAQAMEITPDFDQVIRERLDA